MFVPSPLFKGWDGYQWPMDHNAEICFAGTNKKVTVFMLTRGRTMRKRATRCNKNIFHKVFMITN
jgi:hypothetical protein